MFAPTSAVRRGSALALAAVLLTSGCAAGRYAQTQGQVPTQDGTNATVGTMALRGIALESPSSGAGFAAGSSIPMRLVLINNGAGDDRLTDITTSVARGWAGYSNAAQAALASASTPAGADATGTEPSSAVSSTGQTSVTVPAGQRVSFAVPDSQRVLLLTSSVGHVYPGSDVKVTFTFAKAGRVSARVPVQLADASSGSSRDS